MGKIAILPPALVNQIAAGEVVERPASVVKELVENAVDAGATRVDIQVSDGGRSIRIADNGCGMDADDLQKAFCNHATSKIKNIDDLFAVMTLGFRGEALASVAAISKVTCTSRTLNAEHGLKALVQPDGQVSLQETGCAPGTIFDIRDLFYNVPARLKFMKRPQTELAHIQETVQALALCHPHIAFTLKLEDAQALKTSGQGDPHKVIHEVFSLNAQEQLLPLLFDDVEFGFAVRGFTSSPNTTRGSRKWLHTFVNGRGIKCAILTKAIDTAYQSMIVPGKYPVTVLFLTLPPEEVDVNVHPTKREVKYQQPNTLFSFVRKAVEIALATHGVSSTAHSTAPLPNLKPGPPGFTPRNGGFNKPFAATPQQASSQGTGSLQHRQAAMAFYQPPANGSGAMLSGQEDATTPWLPQRPDYTVIGQLAKTYILVETLDGLLVVDQHIAGERVLFERYAEQAERAEPAHQTLLIPITFPVSAALADVLAQNHDRFAELGFEYTLENQTVVFLQVPSLFSQSVVRTGLEGMLQHLEATGEVKLSFTDVIATAACHSAVRAGDNLTLEQMRRVVEQWFACQRPWTCPHGRPVSHLVAHKDLMAFFERPSLPVR